MVGIKNKHGNGFAVKAALTKTRNAMNFANSTVMYMVQDFEEKLEEETAKLEQAKEVRLQQIPPMVPVHIGAVKRGPGRPPKGQGKMKVAKAAKTWKPAPPGKVRCQCGGTHLPTGNPKGDSSWKSHMQTKRHVEWMSKFARW